MDERYTDLLKWLYLTGKLHTKTRILEEKITHHKDRAYSLQSVAYDVANPHTSSSHSGAWFETVTAEIVELSEQYNKVCGEYLRHSENVQKAFEVLADEMEQRNLPNWRMTCTLMSLRFVDCKPLANINRLTHVPVYELKEFYESALQIMEEMEIYKKLSMEELQGSYRNLARETKRKAGGAFYNMDSEMHRIGNNLARQEASEDASYLPEPDEERNLAYKSLAKGALIQLTGKDI